MGPLRRERRGRGQGQGGRAGGARDGTGAAQGAEAEGGRAARLTSRAAREPEADCLRFAGELPRRPDRRGPHRLPLSRKIIAAAQLRGARMVSRLRSGDPTQVGRYEVLGRIGGGGMGMVYLADGPRGRVALKLVRPELGDDPHFRARFRREVQASFRVSGVCTVRLLDFDTEADQPWMATEYVDGPSLTELIEAGGPLPPAKQLALAVGLAEGLKSIHDEDVVHRDLKPSNVLCADTGPKVIDFGIAAAADAAPLTRSGLMVGSPGWLSPEQIATGRATGASDIFAWGCILAYAAGGEQPFGTGTAEALFYRVLNQGPNVDFGKLHPALHDLVRQATTQDPI